MYLLILSSGNNLNAAGNLDIALRFYSEGRFTEALIEFERTIFYEADSNNISLCRYYKSLCYKKLSKYDRALNELDMINTEAQADSFFISITHEKILCGYLSNDLTKAMHEISGMYRRIKDTLLLMDFIPLDIICLNNCRQWDNALCLWDFYLDNSNLEDSSRIYFKNKVHDIYAENNRPEYYSPVKAGRLSAFLPGAGQFYCGKAVEGVISMTLNAGLFYLTLKGFFSDYYFTGNFISGKLFLKFYTGGIRRAKNLAEAKSEEEMNEFNTVISKLILEEISR